MPHCSPINKQWKTTFENFKRNKRTRLNLYNLSSCFNGWLKAAYVIDKPLKNDDGKKLKMIEKGRKWR